MEKHAFFCVFLAVIPALMLAGSQFCHCLIVLKTGNYTAELTQNLAFLMSICTLFQWPIFFQFVLKACSSLKGPSQWSILLLSSFIVLPCVHSPFHHGFVQHCPEKAHRSISPTLTVSDFLQAHAEF